MKSHAFLLMFEPMPRIGMDCMQEMQRSQTGMKRRIRAIIVASPAPRGSTEAQQAPIRIRVTTTSELVQTRNGFRGAIQCSSTHKSRAGLSAWRFRKEGTSLLEAWTSPR